MSDDPMSQLIALEQGLSKEADPTDRKAVVTSDRHVSGDGSPPIGKPRTTQESIEYAATAARNFTGCKTNDVADRIVTQVAYSLTFPPVKKNAGDQLLKSLAALGELAPQNATEAMLAAQMIAAHDAAMNFLTRATAQDQHSDVIERNVLRATRLMRVFREQLEAMQKLKGKTGQQRVTVEHVHVNAGGQAVVGSVTTAQVREGGGES